MVAGSGTSVDERGSVAYERGIGASTGPGNDPSSTMMQASVSDTAKRAALGDSGATSSTVYAGARDFTTGFGAGAIAAAADANRERDFFIEACSRYVYPRLCL